MNSQGPEKTLGVVLVCLQILKSLMIKYGNPVKKPSKENTHCAHGGE